MQTNQAFTSKQRINRKWSLQSGDPLTPKAIFVPLVTNPPSFIFNQKDANESSEVAISWSTNSQPDLLASNPMDWNQQSFNDERKRSSGRRFDSFVCRIAIAWIVVPRILGRKAYRRSRSHIGKRQAWHSLCTSSFWFSRHNRQNSGHSLILAETQPEA